MQKVIFFNYLFFFVVLFNYFNLLTKFIKNKNRWIELVRKNIDIKIEKSFENEKVSSTTQIQHFFPS